jgi:hypothetical protein
MQNELSFYIQENKRERWRRIRGRRKDGLAGVISPLSHVYGIAAKTSTLKIIIFYRSGKCVGRQGILVFYEWKNGMGVAT